MAKKDTVKDDVEAFVLRDCQYGNAGDVVTLPATDAQTGKEAGALDLHPDAIKHAKK